LPDLRSHALEGLAYPIAVWGQSPARYSAGTVSACLSELTDGAPFFSTRATTLGHGTRAWGDPRHPPLRLNLRYLAFKQIMV